MSVGIPFEIINIILDYADSIFILKINKRTRRENLEIRNNHPIFDNLKRIYKTCNFSQSIDEPYHKQFQISYEIQKNYMSSHNLNDMLSQKYFMTICIDENHNNTEVKHIVSTVIERSNSVYISNSSYLSLG
jgi:hypothetical protein